MKTIRTRIIVERGNKRYEVLLGRDCTRRCSFVKHGPYGPCENGCDLPQWFIQLYKRLIDNGLAYLREIKEVKEQISKKKEGAK